MPKAFPIFVLLKFEILDFSLMQKSYSPNNIKWSYVKAIDFYLSSFYENILRELRLNRKLNPPFYYYPFPLLDNFKLVKAPKWSSF